MSDSKVLERSEITAALVALLAEQTSAQVAPETDLINDLELESVQIMAFVTDVEDHFDIAIALESLADVHRLEQLADIVEQSLREA